MPLVATLLTAIVALLHVWFLVLEIFLWNTPYGRRVFGLTPEFAAASRKLAMNQGLYNGFLAAGLIWGLAAGGELGSATRVFFLGCVVVAGVFGAATANRKILYVQALPAMLAMGATILAG